MGWWGWPLLQHLLHSGLSLPEKTGCKLCHLVILIRVTLARPPDVTQGLELTEMRQPRTISSSSRTTDKFLKEMFYLTHHKRGRSIEASATTGAGELASTLHIISFELSSVPATACGLLKLSRLLHGQKHIFRLCCIFHDIIHVFLNLVGWSNYL